MPEKFEGEPTKEQKEDKRLFITEKDEAHLLELAAGVGMKEENIGAFAVIIVAGVPIQTEITVGDFAWSVFSEDELIAEAAKAPNRLFYDKDNQRLVATTPPLPPLPKAK